MPYVFFDELPEGSEEAEVVERSAMEEADTRIGELESLLEEVEAALDSVSEERDSLASELDEAKRKFADSFLSSPERIKARQREEMREEEKPKTYAELFAGRGEHAD